MVDLPVEELGLDFLDFGGIEAVAALVGAVQHGAAQQVPQLALIKGLAFARLDEIALDHQVRIAVDLDLQALAEFAGVVASHDCYSRFAFSVELVMVRFDIMASLAFQSEIMEAQPEPADWQRELARFGARSGRTMPSGGITFHGGGGGQTGRRWIFDPGSSTVSRPNSTWGCRRSAAFAGFTASGRT